MEPVVAVVPVVGVLPPVVEVSKACSSLACTMLSRSESALQSVAFAASASCSPAYPSKPVHWFSSATRRTAAACVSGTSKDLMVRHGVTALDVDDVGLEDRPHGGGVDRQGAEPDLLLLHHPGDLQPGPRTGRAGLPHHLDGAGVRGPSHVRGGLAPRLDRGQPGRGRSVRRPGERRGGVRHLALRDADRDHAAGGGHQVAVPLAEQDRAGVTVRQLLGVDELEVGDLGRGQSEDGRVLRQPGEDGAVGPTSAGMMPSAVTVVADRRPATARVARRWKGLRVCRHNAAWTVA